MTHVTLNEAARLLSEPVSGKDAVVMAAAGIRELMQVDTCLIYLQDEQDPEILNVVIQGSGSPMFEVIRLDTGMVKECLLEAVTKWFSPGDDDGSGRARELHSLCAPLKAQNQLLGVIEVRSSGFPVSEAPQDIQGMSGSFPAVTTLEFLAAILASSILSGRHVQQQTVVNADLEARCWEIRRERSILADVFHSLPFPFYCIDRDYRLVAVNRFTAQSGNREPHLLLGMRCYEALYQLAEPCPGCRVGESLTSGIMTFRHRRKWQEDGEPREWEISTYPLHDDHNRVAEAVILEQDATEKNRLVESLARTAKLAAVEQLAAGVAHEINNPLVAIIANSQLLQRELESDDSRLESIDLIARAGDRALGVVHALLDLAQQDTYNFTITDVNESIRSAVHLVRHQLTEGAVELNLFLSPDLPLIQASQNHLQGMWLNLLFNARDALIENRGRITVLSEQKGNYILVRVQDDGVGIPDDRLSRIFEPFYTTKAPGSGTGLGLSACHRIVRQHGGKIHVQSIPDQGTEFLVTLPIVT